MEPMTRSSTTSAPEMALIGDMADARGDADGGKMRLDEDRTAAAAPPVPEDLLGALCAHVKAQRLRVLELELALADTQARLLSQAQLLCGTAAGGKGGFFGRRPVREIVEEVLAAYPGVGWADIIGVRRERRLVEPRHACMAAVYEEREDLSLPALGRIFQRDHSSVLHAVNKGRAKR
ncbi:helix-turn-helix domain-containing protein [Ensifer sp.]|uniref:helix-turn-helix domain-containing protein n=1 Tax=Ensifer sp. TaxID=1872086 RepID=UPI00289EE9B0|nr:helix-turn-helix domain-containing protein [Ensifer sp.]